MGLPDDTTECLLYLAVPSMGAKPIDGITDLNPEGLTAAKGKWAKELKARLARGKLKCNLKDGDDFLAAQEHPATFYQKTLLTLYKGLKSTTDSI